MYYSYQIIQFKYCLEGVCVTYGGNFKAFLPFSQGKKPQAKAYLRRKTSETLSCGRIAGFSLLIGRLWKAKCAAPFCGGGEEAFGGGRRGMWEEREGVEGKKTGVLDFAYNCIYTKDCFEQKKTAPYGAVPSHDFFTVPGRWFHGPGDIPKRIKSCHDPQLCLL